MVFMFTSQTASIQGQTVRQAFLELPNGIKTSCCCAGWWWRLLSGGWQWPEVVVLDHGLYVHLPDRLRLDWCRMWAAFVVNDMSTATQIAQRLVGESLACSDIMALA